MSSKKPNKQRKFLAQAPLHLRQRMAAVHLAESLRKQLGKRNIAVRKGDEVRVLRGKYKGTVAKVEEVDLKELKVYLENIKVKKISGKETAIPFHPSKLLITNIVIEDKERKKSIERRRKPSNPIERKK